MKLVMLMLLCGLRLELRVQSKDCTPIGQPGFKCDAKEYTLECADIAGSGPVYEYHGNSWPGPPTNVAVIPYLKYNESTNIFTPGAYLSWSLPENASQNVNGFQLRLKPIGYHWVSELCLIFNLTEATWHIANDTTNVTFKYDLDLGYGAATYVMEFISLPRGPENWKQNFLTEVIKVPKIQSLDPANSATWYTVIGLHWQFDFTLHVQFVAAPKVYGFEKYIISLKNGSYHVIQEDIVTLIEDPKAVFYSYTFENVCVGYHSVKIQPYNPDKLNEEGRCVCKYKNRCQQDCGRSQVSKLKFSGNETLDPCHMSSSTPSTFTTATETATENNEVTKVTISTRITDVVPQVTTIIYEERNVTMFLSPNTWTEKYTVGVSLGVTAGILIVVVVLGVLVYKYKKTPLGNFTDEPAHVSLQQTCSNSMSPGNDGIPTLAIVDGIVMNNLNSGFLELTSRAQVFVLYNPDNIYHEEVVLAFSNFLRTQCGCNVYLDKWYQSDIRQKTKTMWLHEQLSAAQTVIVVNSEGAFRKWKSLLHGTNLEPITTSVSPLGEIFLPGIKMINCLLEKPIVNYNKFISVRFGYTNEDFDLPILSMISAKYSMMEHIEELFFHIHGISKDAPGTRQEVLGLNASDYSCLSLEGKNLFNSIADAVHFQNTNPSWFFNQFVEMPYTCNAANMNCEPKNECMIGDFHSNTIKYDVELESNFTAEDCITLCQDDISVNPVITSDDIKTDHEMTETFSSTSIEV